MQYGNPFANPAINGYGTITNYEYLLPQNWEVNNITSNGSTWIAVNSNNVTITSDLINGDGQYISVRASNIDCGANLAAGQVSRILYQSLYHLSQLRETLLFVQIVQEIIH